ncbi:hypothetical protein [Undibacterium sp. Ji50W]|uniref:hypothetical protein n=1 Tax=Undibacterium sp. Ji50W TaxID=3413041 RepID=UPI003BF5B319
MRTQPDRPPSAFSLTDSLARGLVARLVAEWDEQDKLYLASKDRTGKRCLPRLPGKRALAYRVLCERTKGLVPPGQLILDACHGKQTGLDKAAGYAVLHWRALAQSQRLDLLMTYVSPGWRIPRRWGLVANECPCTQAFVLSPEKSGSSGCFH